MDAGAGLGIFQWWLATQEIDVLSVDRMSRYYLPIHFRRQYKVNGWRFRDLFPSPWVYIYDFLPSRTPRNWHLYIEKLNNSLRELTRQYEPILGRGRIYFYRQSLNQLLDVSDDSIDAVVSISALEHNSPGEFRSCVGEILRVLKPGGKLIATLGASKDQDWFHEPSSGWCYTGATLRDIFDLPADCPSTFKRYDELFNLLKESVELRENLAGFYYDSGDNGMPWGICDPKYQPVGIVKVKQFASDVSPLET